MQSYRDTPSYTDFGCTSWKGSLEGSLAVVVQTENYVTCDPTIPLLGFNLRETFPHRSKKNVQKHSMLQCLPKWKIGNHVNIHQKENE